MTDYTPIADAVAAAKAQVVMLGSVDVPTVSAFMQAFEQAHYNPKAFIATAGPDQGNTFVKAVGAGNTDGMMVPNAWYGGSQQRRQSSHGRRVHQQVRRHRRRASTPTSPRPTRSARSWPRRSRRPRASTSRRSSTTSTGTYADKACRAR